MGRHFFSTFAVFLIGASSIAPLSAQQAEEFPTVNTLSCGANCKAATEPKALGSHEVRFPDFPETAYPMDGLVIIRATVAKDGTLQDPQVVRLIGVKVFAARALDAIKQWRYKPATRNGVPVDRPNWELQVTFWTRPIIGGAREDVVRAFRTANALSGEGKQSEAIAMLLPLLDKPRLNFYERQVVSLQLASDYLRQGDVIKAREYLDDMDLIGDKYLSRSQRSAFWKMAVLANAQTGQLLEAKHAFAELDALSTVAADDPLRKVMQSTDEAIAQGRVLTAEGRIAENGVLQSWGHRLMRHKFSLTQIVGKLDRLTIVCGEQKTESPISSTVDWHIPKDWEKCRLQVHGDPGASFKVVEMDD